VENLSKEQKLIILGLILVIFSGLGVMAYRRLAPATGSEIIIEEPNHTIEKPKIIVHVTGAVIVEGVYKLKAGDRVVDAIELAGGILPNADLSTINLAEKIKDGVRILVPAKPKVIARLSDNQMTRKSGTSPAGKVNINTASEKDLCKVKGIGKTTAKKIVDHRSSNGPFAKIEDIMKVKSIGKGKFGKIKGMICL